MDTTATVARSNAFLVSMNLIDDLERYALHAGPTVEATRLPGASQQEQAVFRTPRGALEVQDWLAAYRHSIDLLRQFREAMLRDPGDSTDDDIREVTDGAERVLRGLLRRLTP